MADKNYWSVRSLLGSFATLVLTCSYGLNELAAAEFPGLGDKGQLVSIEFEPAGRPVLRGKNARRQLVVTGVYSSGQRHDLSHDVSYASSNPQVLSVAAGGFVTPLADGQATVTAQGPEGKTAELALAAERCNEQLPVSFEDEVVPIFTRLGCNAGGCHGKADGQNGFKLSLLGFYPDEDYEFLVHESRGRRVFPGDPDFSLLLLKPANLLPHGGGKRMSPGTYEWELVADWIRQGMPAGAEDAPKLQRPTPRSVTRCQLRQQQPAGAQCRGRRLCYAACRWPGNSDGTRTGRQDG